MITELFGALSGIDADLDGSHLRVLDQGAQVVDWTPAGQKPVLFASALAIHEQGRHVRAGAPLVFPWFGFGVDGAKQPVHGYARLRPFEREAIEEVGDQIVIRHLLTPSQAGDIPASLLVTTKMRVDCLEIALTVTNWSDAAATYEIGLHTYFTVGDVEHISVKGLEDCAYLDRVTGQRAEASKVALTIHDEIDRAYDHLGSVVVEDARLGRDLIISKAGSATTIVWNPGAEKTRGFADFGDDEWRGALCVEAANMGVSAITLQPGEVHTLTQRVESRH